MEGELSVDEYTTAGNTACTEKKTYTATKNIFDRILIIVGES